MTEMLCVGGFAAGLQVTLPPGGNRLVIQGQPTLPKPDRNGLVSSSCSLRSEYVHYVARGAFPGILAPEGWTDKQVAAELISSHVSGP